MRRRLPMAVLPLLLVWLVVAGSANAQLKSPFRRAEKPAGLELTASEGPWLIMCASFYGQSGESQANQLATELRDQHHLEAWLYRHKFDYSESIKAIGWDPPEPGSADPNPVRKKLSAAQGDSFEEIAVVVGSFPSLDDHRAQRTLESIKRMSPRALGGGEYVSTSQSMGVLRTIARRMNSDTRGPMGSAFLMPNPLLPSDFFENRSLDDVLVKLNKGNRYNLIQCPGRYSVKVATFKGDQTFSKNEIVKKQAEYRELIESGKPLTESKLAEAGAKANLLCLALRKRGIEAWEFHDHHESYVCVGSFDWAARTVDYGPDELNPEVAEVIRQYKATETWQGGQKVLAPRTVRLFQGMNINFDVQPLPVTVPQVSAGKGIFGR